MVNTRIVEVRNNDGQTEEIELGFCVFPEVPVEKRSPLAAKPDDAPPPPMVIRVNDVPMFVIGHTWEVRTDGMDEATFVLIVQKIPARPAIITADDMSAMDKLRHLALDIKKN